RTMNKIMLVLLTLCCAIQTMCSTENIEPKSDDSEYRERIGQIAKSCSSEHCNMPHEDRIPAQHGIPTLHEIAFKKLEPRVIEAITDLIKNKYDDENDKQNKLDFIKLIAAHSPHALGKFINAPINKRNSRLLHIASNENNSEVTQYLITAGADTNQQNNFFITPLHYAATRNCYKAISLLIAAGANVNQQDFFIYTPLHHAVLNNSYETITVLIDAGANETIQNFSNKTPRMCTNNPTTLQIFDQAIAARPLKQKSATKIQALGRGFIARKNK
ncbi:MAG: ankyrin repeat domain-containing protein, partial [Candidatus Chromulinivorax sp.]|nr:ankyrin repeat domain-containing protein [Candidatus Chromulinivorax sp.]